MAKAAVSRPGNLRPQSRQPEERDLPPVLARPTSRHLESRLPQKLPEVILTESVIDALTFWVNGFRNVTCIYGTEGFTDDHLEAFKRHKTQKIYLAYDRDKAGDRAAERDASRLGSIGIECFRVRFPAGHDANEYALKVTPASKSSKP